MQHHRVHQQEQAFVSHDDRQHFIEEISTLRILAQVAGIVGPPLEELEAFEHEVEHLDASAWERKETRNLKRNELVRLSSAVLRAYFSRSD